VVTQYVIEGSLENTAIWERYAPYVHRNEDWATYTSFKSPTTDSLGKRIRFLNMSQLVRQAPATGGFAECGCFTGHSTHVIATTMVASGRQEPLYVFDSFAGISPASEQDLTTEPGATGLQARLRSGEPMFASTQDVTMANLSAHKQIKFFPGWIPERFNEVADETFAFVHIDVDVYAPTRDSLNFFYPRLVKGGFMQLDDYNILDWPGSTKAVDEFLAEHKPAVFIQLALGGAFLMK